MRAPEIRAEIQRLYLQLRGRSDFGCGNTLKMSEESVALEDQIRGLADRYKRLIAPTTTTDDEDDHDPRVDHSQYVEPLATAGSA